MFNSFASNELLLSMMSTLAGDDVDLESAREAFDATTGDFRAKFTAAVQARLAELAVPEVFIEVPDHPEQLRKSDLDELVRPAAYGFLRSYPTKDELLDQVGGIRRRQERRPAWIPRIDRDGEPITPIGTESIDVEREPDRELQVTALPEIGDVTVWLPEAGQDRPELAMTWGGIGEWEATLYSLLGLVGRDPATPTVVIDAAANEALVPDEMRWWSSETLEPVPAMQDPGVASELLATCATLGERPVADNSLEGYETMVAALASAGDWRYSSRWVLETWDPSDDAGLLAIARAAIAGWADEHHSGVIVYVYGGTLHPTEGLIGSPGPLHSYVLAVTRSADGTDTVDTVQRMIWSCPGEYWCHRGGCPDVDFPEAESLLTPIIAAGHAAEAATDRSGSRWAEPFDQLYGDGYGTEYADRVLEQATAMLSGADWVELEQSEWEGGLEQSLLRRGEHCLTVEYDPVTRQLQLTDGKPELEATLQLLADEGVLIGDDARESVDTNETVVERWGNDLLAAADDLLHGRINELPQLTSPVQVTLLGLHPHADGTLRAPRAATLAEHQLGTLFRGVGLLAARK